MSTTAHTVIRVLRSASAQRIDFRLGSMTVNGAGLARVAGLIALGTISVQVGKDMPANAEAAYVNDTNEVLLPREYYGVDAYQRCCILHECVHALHDMYGGGSYTPQLGGSRFTPRSENEATAAVADALYYLYETRGGVQPGGHIEALAATVAKRIANTPGAVVTEAEAKALRIAVVWHPKLYNYDIDAPTAADGTVSPPGLPSRAPWYR